MAAYQFDENEQISLCEAIDRILNKGAVIVGEATISVADVDLIYLALQVVLSSVETVRHGPQGGLLRAPYGIQREINGNEFLPAGANSIRGPG